MLMTNFKFTIQKHADNAHITILDAADELMQAEKEKMCGIIDAMQMDNLIASNIETMNNIHKQTFRVIELMMQQALVAHPHYEDSYPPILAHLKKTYFEKGKI